MTEPATAPSSQSLTAVFGKITVLEIVVSDDTLWINLNGSLFSAKNCKHLYIMTEDYANEPDRQAL